jgi:hypothetical protein
MGNVKAREGWDEAHLGASSQATKSAPKDAAHATCDLGDTSLVSCIKVCIVSNLFPYYINTKMRCSKTALESDVSDEGSIIDAYPDPDQEGVVSNKDESRTEEGREGDGDEDARHAHSIAMPTWTNYPSMDSFTNSRGASVLQSFADNSGASALHPSDKNYDALAIHPSISNHGLGTLETEPFLLTSEPTRAGRKWKCRDMSGLSLCLCGVSVQPDSVGSIRCQRTGCETVWVSNHFFPPFIGIWLNLYTVVSFTMRWVC